jgi:hypothetical protein
MESKHGQLKKQHSFKAHAQDVKVLKSIERLEAAVAGGKAAVTNFADVVYLARAKMLAKDWILCGNGRSGSDEAFGFGEPDEDREPQKAGSVCPKPVWFLTLMLFLWGIIAIQTSAAYFLLDKALTNGMSVGEVSALIADGSLQWKQYQAPSANTGATAGNQAGSSVAGTTAPTAAPTDGDDGRHRRNHDQVVIQTKQLDAAEKEALESEAAFKEFLNAQTTQNEEIAALFQKQYGTSPRTKYEEIQLIDLQDYGVCAPWETGGRRGLGNLMFGAFVLYAFVFNDIHGTFISTTFHPGIPAKDVRAHKEEGGFHEPWVHVLAFITLLGCSFVLNVLVAISGGATMMTNPFNFQAVILGSLGSFVLLNIDGFALPWVSTFWGIKLNKDSTLYAPEDVLSSKGIKIGDSASGYGTEEIAKKEAWKASYAITLQDLIWYIWGRKGDNGPVAWLVFAFLVTSFFALILGPTAYFFYQLSNNFYYALCYNQNF